MSSHGVQSKHINNHKMFSSFILDCTTTISTQIPETPAGHTKSLMVDVTNCYMDHVPGEEEVK